MTIDIYQPTANDTLSLEEYGLYNLIMAYRASEGLAPIALSQALTTTAGRHAEDTTQNIWAVGLELPKGANMHSWSDAPYFADHRDPTVMWEAPERIGTGFTGNGYEISVTIGDDGTIQQALALWQGSGPHNDVILNQDIWTQLTFTAMGVGIDRLANQQATHLSYGDQRRLEIARALASEPKLLALDEPAAGMNATETAGLRTLIEKLRGDGLTVLLIEHDVKLVMGLCDRVAVLDYGEKIAEDIPDVVRRHPRVITAYLGQQSDPEAA